MDRRLVYLLTILYAFLCFLSICFFNGTGDSEDSIAHYLFANSAPLHTGLYFDHWAKPVYVLLASPFAQLGFVGLKIFNSLVNLCTILLTYKITRKLEMKNSLVVVVIMMFTPLYYILTFSGLTEPLFALFVAAGLLLTLHNKHIPAALVISFLPYVRSEGLIILGVFGFYYLLKRNWTLLPWLITGSVVYGIAGFFFHGSLLWVFTRIPYAQLGSAYGHGEITHFVTDLIHVIGVPIYGLFWIGFCFLVYRLIKRQTKPEESILILLGFTCYITAHSLFWYLGIFNSMGLKRVMLGVMPLIAVISLHGFNFVTEWVSREKHIWKNTLRAAVLFYVLVFPFTPNPAAIDFRKHMMLCKEQELAGQVTDFVKTNVQIKYPLVYNHHYFSVTFGLDHFDKSKKKDLSRQKLSLMKTGEIIIWDSRYAARESGISKEELDNDSNFEGLFSCHGPERFGEIVYAVYRKR